MKEVMFGCAEADITPTYPVRTLGFSREDEWSQGVESPLLVQTAVWKSKEEICCLITLDHIGFSKIKAQELREKVSARLRTETEKVMICFSHTHSAPNKTIEKRYLKFVFDQVFDCIESALKNMCPIQAVWGNAIVDIGINQRKGGFSVDRRAGILLVTDLMRKPLLILLRLTAHANVLKQDNYLISPDYFGAVRKRMKEEYHCQIMVTQGASGNIAPKYFQSWLIPPDAVGEEFIRSETALNDMAEEIYIQTGKVIAYMTPHPIQQLEMYSKQVHLYSEVPEYMRKWRLKKKNTKQKGRVG